MDYGLKSLVMNPLVVRCLVIGFWVKIIIKKKVYVGNLRNGIKSGKWTTWYYNGRKGSEVTYKDGEKDGLWTDWYENGQKKEEGTFKDGKLEGLVTGWYENGQRMGEYTYKDGKLISKKEWNEDGSVRE